jgi:hypothetical protein
MPLDRRDAFKYAFIILMTRARARKNVGWGDAR